MFISKKKYKDLLKRIADLEGQVQSQQSPLKSIKDSFHSAVGRTELIQNDKGFTLRVQ